jgi:hypothetical protein
MKRHLPAEFLQRSAEILLHYPTVSPSAAVSAWGYSCCVALLAQQSIGFTQPGERIASERLSPERGKQGQPLLSVWV